MNEGNILEMEAEIFALIMAIVMLAVQLVLCFKVRKLWVRLIPMCICAIAAFGCLLVTFFADGWDAIGFLFLTIFFICLLLACGFGWGIWAISRRRK